MRLISLINSSLQFAIIFTLSSAFYDTLRNSLPCLHFQVIPYQSLKGPASSWHSPCKRVGMKILILSCLLAVTLVGIVGCCDDTQRQTSSTATYDSSVTDSKNMQHR